MSPLVRRFLKTAILFLLFGLGLGVYMLVRRELDGAWSSPWWISAHTHALLVGFVMMMILGVALWMFPRPASGDQRFDPRFAEAAYWLLTVGTAARVGGELLRGFFHQDEDLLRRTLGHLRQVKADRLLPGHGPTLECNLAEAVDAALS